MREGRGASVMKGGREGGCEWHLSLDCIRLSKRQWLDSTLQ